MELNELKKTWEQLSPRKELDETQLREMLRHRTRNLLDRIERNVRIGFVLLFVLIALFLLDDFVLTPMLIKEMSVNIEIPVWLTFLSAFSNVLIFATFIYFMVQYFKIKKRHDISGNMKETLEKIISAMQIYQKLFYMALITLSFAMVLQFISGMSYGIENQNIDISQVPLYKWIFALGVLIFTVGSIYLLWRWGFRKLYGKYIAKLRQTLRELNEIDN
ncbi:hypothetical protein SAMN05444274_105108 [Mariniphaga anaerophila]|uniref:Uncharacterized protein n=1 Tax=Mariniphaga anaerophila TaxID=1484053 RepID=A0A1M5BEG6_9BACT|nr:hypothetical protein [Mariniphaga anaerophila]SHF40805.1 hypothetical protein SAMN05444274_105108 [Mariniphaga anaerophila]